jgi:hypothetical protein
MRHWRSRSCASRRARRHQLVRAAAGLDACMAQSEAFDSTAELWCVNVTAPMQNAAQVSAAVMHAAGGSKAKKHRAKHSPQSVAAELPRTVLHDSSSTDRQAADAF